MIFRPEAPDPYSPLERRALDEAVRSGAPAICPACGVPMDRRSIDPRMDVPYVRSRVWLTCPSCGRSIVVDRKKT